MLSGPAGAVGDTGLSKLIVADPVPGWQPESAASLNRVVTYIDGLESDSIVPKGGNAVTAVQGWQNPAASGQYVVVALVALTLSGSSASSIDNATKQGAVGALAALCAGVSAQSSVQAGTVAGVPGSHTLTCTLKKAGQAGPLAAGWSRANVLALVLSVQGAVTGDQLSAISTAQYAAMPSTGYSVPPGGGGGALGTVLELLAGLVVLAAAGWALWRVVQRADRRGGSGGSGGSGGGGRSGAPRPRVKKVKKVKEQPEVRRGVVQRPASLAGGVGPSGRPPGGGEAPGGGATRPRPQP